MSTRGPGASSARDSRARSRAVYRRRRLGALLVAVLVIGGLVWGIGAVVGALGGRGSVAEPTTGPTDDALPTETDPQPCAADAVAVALDVPPSTGVGEGLGIGLVVTNTGEAPCLLDAGPAAIVVSVRSGEDRLWSSAHCAGEAQRPLLLDAGATHETSVRWTGVRSAEGCPGDQPVAGTGTYRVGVDAGGSEAAGDESVFVVG